MARATLTFEDTDSGIDITIDFDPPVAPGAETSIAQYAASLCLKRLQETNGGLEEDDE